MRPFGTARELEQRRLAAVRLLSEGVSAADVARRVNVDSRSVRRWRAAARVRGEAGVAARPASGRPARLTGGDLRLLRRLLLEAAQDPGVPAGPWSCAAVSGLIQHQFGVRYHPSHVSRILHRLGIVPRKRCR
jgi:transposase